MKKVKHEGHIKQIIDKRTFVEIISLSACASCKSKNMCNMSESKEKIIEVLVDNPENYSIGQTVNIVMQERMGLKAVFLAYVMPFFVCIIALFGLSFVSNNELIYGSGSILAAVFYYLILSQFSNRLSKEFVWYLE